MKNSYMTVETTFMPGCACFSFQSDKDIQNGAIVGKGELIEGEDSIYAATDDYSGGMYLVANPAWDYETSRKENQNEENFINKAGIPFRVYELKKDRKYTVGNLPSSVTLEKGDFVEFKDGTYAKASGTQLKVAAVKEGGFPFFAGSYGTPVEGDTTNEHGHAIGTKNKKYTIEVTA